MRSLPATIALTATLTFAASAATQCSPPPSSPPTSGGPAIERPVVVFGDSVLWQADANMRFAFASASKRPATVRAFGGTALCDWVQGVRDALAAKPKPAAIALSFTGNHVTPCTGGSNGQPGPEPGTSAFYEHNRRAMDQIRSAAAAAKVPVVWVTPPPLGSTTSDHIEVFEQMAERRGFDVVSAGDAVTSTPDRFVSTMPCLPDEGASRGCQSGRIRVRADDKVHFFVTRDGYSSGGRRWSDATAQGVLALLAA